MFTLLLYVFELVGCVGSSEVIAEEPEKTSGLCESWS